MSEQIILISVFGWIARQSSMVGTIPMFLVAFSGTQLKDVFPYPMSRQKRATAFFASSLFDAVTMTAVIAFAIVALAYLGLWRDDPATSMKTPGDALMRLVFLFLFVPIVQWAQAHSAAFSRRGKPVSARQYITFMSAMLVWAGLIVAVTALGFVTLLIGMVVVAPLLGHATWHAYRDLVR